MTDLPYVLLNNASTKTVDAVREKFSGKARIVVKSLPDREVLLTVQFSKETNSIDSDSLLHLDREPQTKEEMNLFLWGLESALNNAAKANIEKVACCSSVSFLVVGPDDLVHFATGHPMGLKCTSTASELVGIDIREALSPLVIQSEDGFCLSLAKARNNKPTSPVFALHLDDKSDVKQHWALQVLSAPELGEQYVLVQISDTTEEYSRMQALENSRQFSEDVLRSLNSGLAVVDNHGNVLISNLSAASILGLTRDEIQRQGLPAILGDQAAANLLCRKTDYQQHQHETKITTKDGREIFLGFSLSTLADKNGAPIGTIINFKDVTEIKQLKHQMIHQEKMAAIGSLAGGVAHEFNNLIGGMMGYAQLAQATGEISDYEKCVNVVFDSTRRAKEIVSSLLTFARRPEGILDRIRLTDLVDQVLIMVQRSVAKYGIHVERRDEFAGFLRMDVSRLQLVVLNLIINAKDAMPDGGVLSVASWQKNNKVLFSVADTGLGIAQEDLYRVFEPFFTTKGALGGSSTPGNGLGLWASYGIIQALGGEITVESRVGGGTTFTVSLPLTLESEEDYFSENSVVEPTEQETPNVFHALVMEPDDKLRQTLTEFLDTLDCRVTGVGNWKSALDASRYHFFDWVFFAGQEPINIDAEEVSYRRAFELENSKARYICCLEDSSAISVDELTEVLIKPYRLLEISQIVTSFRSAQTELNMSDQPIHTEMESENSG